MDLKTFRKIWSISTKSKVPTSFFVAVLLFSAALTTTGCGRIWGTVTGLNQPGVSPNLSAKVYSATWVSGSNQLAELGSCGVQGVGSILNYPGGRQQYAGAWSDSSGNIWLFGGGGEDCGGQTNNLNILLKYTTGNQQWTWIEGSEFFGQSGTYGVQGTGSTSNIPGARQQASSWSDNAGNFWLFGGQGYDSVGASGRVNDVWKFNPGNLQWTWITGAQVVNQNGVPGIQGTPNAANTPGARFGQTSVADASGNLWLFGGFGYDSAGDYGQLNDLWFYNIGSNQWTWLTGTSNLVWQASVYGTKGVGSALNTPGNRTNSCAWTDANGDLWLFGGNGTNNDLWEYTPGNGQWTWVGGSNLTNQSGVYGVQGVASASNIPGGHYSASCWKDKLGNFWLFGGYGYDSVGANGYLNDLWKFSPSTQMWTWVAGSNLANQLTIYGTQGTPGAMNVPGARRNSFNWVDASGNFWLFGGEGYNGAANGFLNDLWLITP